MTEIKRNIIIEAPVNKVFEYAADYKNWSKFFEGVSDFKPITAVTRGSGSKYIYKAKALGMNITVGTEVQQFKENEGWIGKSFKGMEHSTQWIFEKSNSNTEFTFIQRYKLPFYRPIPSHRRHCMRAGNESRSSASPRIRFRSPPSPRSRISHA